MILQNSRKLWKKDCLQFEHCTYLKLQKEQSPFQSTFVSWFSSGVQAVPSLLVVGGAKSNGASARDSPVRRLAAKPGTFSVTYPPPMDLKRGGV